MTFRRMRRVADLVDLVNDLENYGTSLKNKLEGVLQSYKDQADKIEKSIGELDQASADQKNEKGREVKKSIMNLVNGEGDFPGLSELPETEDYGTVYDRIVKEYNDLKVRKTQRSLDGVASESEKALMEEYGNGKQKIGEVINSFKQWNLKKILDVFVGVLKDQYGADYARGWNPLEQAVLDLLNEFVGILVDFQKLFGSTFRKENLSEFNKMLEGGYQRQLLSDMQDFNYYVQQFKTLYKGQPPDYEKKPYDDVMKSMNGTYQSMKDAYEWVTDFGEVIDEYAEIIQRNTSGETLEEEVAAANDEEFGADDSRPGM